MPSHHHDHDSLALDDRSQRRPDTGHPHGDSQAQILDLDAEVLAEQIAAIVAWLPVETAPGEILDLGAGTGAGSLALLSRFPDAHLTAVDSSAEHLERLRTKARSAGLGDRVQVVQADLDAAEWPDLGAPDLVWASASMHHLADPGHALRTVRDILAPGGLVAVVELDGLPRFLPPSAPEDRPGLEERCHAATQRLRAEHLPHLGADWAPELTAAGLTVQDHLVMAVDVAGTQDNEVGAYALAALQGLRRAVDGVLPAEDLAALDRLLDPGSADSILRRPDLRARTTRTVWAARRPGEDITATGSAPVAGAADGPSEWFSAAAEAANCERLLGQRRHGLETVLAGGGATTPAG